MLAGRGISWHGGRTAEVGARATASSTGPHSGAHTLHALEPRRRAGVRPARVRREPRVPAARDVAGRQPSRRERAVRRRSSADPVRHGSRAGSARAARARRGRGRTTVVHLDAVEPIRVRARPRGAHAPARRAGRRAPCTTGLQHVVVEPGAESGAAALPFGRGGDLRDPRRRRRARARRRRRRP